jgi:hypothetical protein
LGGGTLDRSWKRGFIVIVLLINKITLTRLDLEECQIKEYLSSVCFLEVISIQVKPILDKSVFYT